MMQIQPSSRFQKYQNIYFKITWVLLIISCALAVVGYLMVQAMLSAPMILVQFATFVLYYHVFHFFYGIFSFIYYFAKVRKKIGSTKIYKTLIGIILSPASAFAAYIAVFLIAVSACSAS
jgi:hypothetical protein